jgi:hypothetical protein
VLFRQLGNPTVHVLDEASFLAAYTIEVSYLGGSAYPPYDYPFPDPEPPCKPTASFSSKISSLWRRLSYIARRRL